MDQSIRHMIDDLISTLRGGLPAVLAELDPAVPVLADTSYLRWGRPSWPHLPAIEVSATMLDGQAPDPGLFHAYAAVELLCVTHAQRPGMGYDALMDVLDTYAQGIVTTVARYGDGAAGPHTRLRGFRFEHRADPWFRDTNDAPSRASLVALRFETDVDLQG